MASELGFIYNAGMRWKGSMIDIRCKHDYDEGLFRERMLTEKFTGETLSLKQNSLKNGINTRQNCDLPTQCDGDILRQLAKLTQVPSFILKLQVEAMNKCRLYAKLIKMFADGNNAVTTSSVGTFCKEVLMEKSRRRHSLNIVLSDKNDRLSSAKEENIFRFRKCDSTSLVIAKTRSYTNEECDIDISGAKDADIVKSSSKNFEIALENRELPHSDRDNFRNLNIVGVSKDLKRNGDTGKLIQISDKPHIPDDKIKKASTKRLTDAISTVKIEKSNLHHMHSKFSSNVTEISRNTTKTFEGKLKRVKSVRFADEFGDYLVRERQIVDQDSPLMLTGKCTEARKEGNLRCEMRCTRKPTSIYKSSNKRCEVPLSHTNLKRSNSNYRMLAASDISCPFQWKFIFDQPIENATTFRQRLEANNVCLENVFGSTTAYELDTVRLYGKIKVRNIAFQKKVGLRITTNNWKSFTDHYAEYCEENSRMLSDNTQVDTFLFSLPIKIADQNTEHSNQSDPILRELKFAVFFEVGTDASYWDNNHGCNYTAARVMSGSNSPSSDEQIFY